MKENTYRLRSLVWISLPAILALLVDPLAGLIDTAFVGNLHTQWLAALGIATTIFSSFAWIFNFLVYVVTTKVANAFGKKDSQALSQNIKLALLLSVCLGLLSSAILIATEELIVIKVMGASRELYEVLHPYYSIRSLGMPFVLLVSALNGSIRGLQRLDQALVILIVVTIVNIALTYLLLFQFDMSLIGAAIGTVVSFVAGSIYGVLVLMRSPLDLNWRINLDFSVLKNFSADALNHLGRTAALMLAFLLSSMVATRMGEISIASYQIGFQFWILASFIVEGFAVTANALGAKLHGAKDQKQFDELTKNLVILSFISGLIFTSLMFLAQKQLISIFTQDIKVISKVATFWWVIAIIQPIAAIAYVYDGLLFSLSAFGFLRRRVTEGVFLIFAPVLGVSYFTLNDIAGIWVALSLLAIFRLVSSACYFRFRTDYFLSTAE